MLICLIIDVSFDHLAELMSAGFLCLKTIFSSFVVNKSYVEKTFEVV